MKIKRFPSIISNTCWGGMINKIYEEPYNSVFTGSFIVGEDYVKLLSTGVRNWNYEEVIWLSRRKSIHLDHVLGNETYDYPMAVLWNTEGTQFIEILYPHYDLIEEAKVKYERRLARMNFDNLVIKSSLSRSMTYDHLNEILALDLEERQVIIMDNIIPYMKYQKDNLRIVQSKASQVHSPHDVFDDPWESLHNMNYDFFGFKLEETNKDILKRVNRYESM